MELEKQDEIPFDVRPEHSKPSDDEIIPNEEDYEEED